MVTYTYFIRSHGEIGRTKKPRDSEYRIIATRIPKNVELFTYTSIGNIAWTTCNAFNYICKYNPKKREKDVVSNETPAYKYIYKENTPNLFPMVFFNGEYSDANNSTKRLEFYSGIIHCNPNNMKHDKLIYNETALEAKAIIHNMDAKPRKDCKCSSIVLMENSDYYDCNKKYSPDYLKLTERKGNKYDHPLQSINKCGPINLEEAIKIIQHHCKKTYFEHNTENLEDLCTLEIYISACLIIYEVTGVIEDYEDTMLTVENIEDFETNLETYDLHTQDIIVRHNFLEFRCRFLKSKSYSYGDSSSDIALYCRERIADALRLFFRAPWGGHILLEHQPSDTSRFIKIQVPTNIYSDRKLIIQEDKDEQDKAFEKLIYDNIIKFATQYNLISIKEYTYFYKSSLKIVFYYKHDIAISINNRDIIENRLIASYNRAFADIIYEIPPYTMFDKLETINIYLKVSDLNKTQEELISKISSQITDIENIEINGATDDERKMKAWELLDAAGETKKKLTDVHGESKTTPEALAPAALAAPSAATTPAPEARAAAAPELMSARAPPEESASFAERRAFFEETSRAPAALAPETKATETTAKNTLLLSITMIMKPHLTQGGLSMKRSVCKKLSRKCKNHRKRTIKTKIKST